MSAMHTGEAAGGGLRFPQIPPAGLLYGAAVYFFMDYLVLPLSAVAATTFHLGLFLNGVIGHALSVGLPISLAARRVQ